MLRETLNCVGSIVAKFLSARSPLAGLGVDGSGQSGDAVDIAAAVREMRAEGLLDTPTVAFDGLGERSVHGVLAAVHRRRLVEFPISPEAATAINHAVRPWQPTGQFCREKREHRGALGLKGLGLTRIKVYPKMTRFDDVVLAGLLVKGAPDGVRRKIEIKSSAAVVGDERLLPARSSASKC